MRVGERWKLYGGMLLLLAAAPGYGQRSSEDALRVTVTPRDAVAIAGQPSKLHWVIDPMPAAADVLVTNQTLKEALTVALGGLKARKPNCLVWYTEKSPRGLQPARWSSRRCLRSVSAEWISRWMVQRRCCSFRRRAPRSLCP